MRLVVLALLFFSVVSAKVLVINGDTYSLYSGRAVNGSFFILPIGDFEKNISGDIVNGKWSTQVNFDESKTEKILIITNTSKNVGFNVFELSSKNTDCRENVMRIRPIVFNTTPVRMKMEIEDTSYKNIPVNVGEENRIVACLIPGKIYKVNLFADSFYSFFYVGR